MIPKLGKMANKSREVLLQNLDRVNESLSEQRVLATQRIALDESTLQNESERIASEGLPVAMLLKDNYTETKRRQDQVKESARAHSY